MATWLAMACSMPFDDRDCLVVDEKYVDSLDFTPSTEVAEEDVPHNVDLCYSSSELEEDASFAVTESADEFLTDEEPDVYPSDYDEYDWDPEDAPYVSGCEDYDEDYDEDIDVDDGGDNASFWNNTEASETVADRNSNPWMMFPSSAPRGISVRNEGQKPVWSVTSCRHSCIMRLQNYTESEAVWFTRRLPMERGCITIHFDEETDIWEIEFDKRHWDVVINAIHLVDEQCNFLTTMKFPGPGP